MAIVICPERGMEVRADLTFKECQDIVGGPIEVLRLDLGRVMLVNENGHLLGLPCNVVATLLGPASTNIVGTVILTSCRHETDLILG